MMKEKGTDALNGVFLAGMASGMGFILGYGGYFIATNELGLQPLVGTMIGLVLGVSTLVVYFKEMN